MSEQVLRIAHQDGVERPYGAATLYGGLVFPCGQIPTRVDGSVPSEFAEQVTVVIDNLERALLAAGSDLSSILQLTVYLADLTEFDVYNVAYLKRLSGYPLPPRTTVQVAGFRGDKRIEISAIAAHAAPNSFNEGKQS